MLNSCYKKKKLERLEEEIADLEWEVSILKAKLG
jgi:archaellum component FlaC